MNDLTALLFLYVALPVALLAGLAIVKARSRLVWIAYVLLIVGYLFTLSRAGAGWHLLADDLPWLWWVGFLLASLFSSYRMGGAPLKPPSARGWIVAGVLVAMAAAFAFVLVTRVLPAREYEGEAVELGFPLGPGELYVTDGGSSELTNRHFDVAAQRYALDFVALNDWGGRADGLFPSDNSAYSVYGAPVRSPCAGRVATAHDGLDNNTPPARDDAHPAGNHLVLHCTEGDVTVLLAHLEKNSLIPKAGKKVRLGEELAAVGNSGASSEPHLHMHAVRGKVTDAQVLLETGEAVPITFSGRFLIRNDKIVVR